MKFSTIFIAIFVVFLILIGYKGLTTSSSKSNSHYNPAFGSTDPKVVQLKKEIDSTMKSLLSTINNISDAPSARQAVPTLIKISEDLNSYLDRMKPIPDDDKLQIKNYMMDFVKYLKQPLERLSKIPEALPIIDKSITKIDTVLMFYKPI